jgi:hypothetical protein
MIKKGHLFFLVKSLTKTEKRYFKLFVSNQKSDTNYLQLFNVIDKQEQFDEEAIRKKFKGETFVNQLHVAKIYLYELILRSLRNYHSNDSVSGQILNLLRDTDILYRRELYEASLLKIEKAEKLALRYEKIVLLLEVLQWKRKLLLTQAGPAGEGANVILDAEKSALGRLHDLHNYWHKTHNVFEFVKGKSSLKELDVRQATTLQAMTLHRHLLYSIYFMNGQMRKAEDEIALLISFLEKDPLRIEDDPGSYVTAISNKIGLLLAQKRWDETGNLILQMRTVPAKYKLTSQNNFTVRLWLRIFNLELEVYRDTLQLSKATVLIREVEKFMRDHKNSIPDNYRIMLYYQVACIYFLKQDFSRSLVWINEIVNINFGGTRPELQCFARILNLMIHFELNNIIVLRYAVDSCRRFLKKMKMLGSFEKELLILFSRLSLAPNVGHAGIIRERASYLAEHFMSDLEKMRDYIDIRAWLETRKSTGKKYSKVQL